MIRVVLDTNILISSIFWKGSCQKIIDFAVAGKIKSLTCAEILEEIESVLSDDFPDVPYTKIDEIIRDVLSYSEIVTTEELLITGLRDIKDTKIIACALGGKADYIITGDKDLLTIKAYEGIPIVNPSEFLSSIMKKKP